MDPIDSVKRNLKEELKAVPGDRFMASRWRGQPGDEPVYWILAAALKPLVEGPVLQIGLTEDGNWVVAAGDGSVVDVKAADNYMPLFPLFEMSLEEARERLASEFRKHQLNENWLLIFPFEDLVSAALTTRSKSWAGLALDWANTLGPSDALCAAVDLARGTGMTQAQRHRAAQILSRWRRQRDA